VITCYVQYEIEPDLIEEFKHYAKLWVPLVAKHGGLHHGYFMPHESANDLALALFSFVSLADYERYRFDILQDPECVAAFEYAQKTRCIRRYDRQFLKPFMVPSTSSMA